MSGESPRVMVAKALRDAGMRVPVHASVPPDLPVVGRPVVWLRSDQWEPQSGESFLKVGLTLLLVSGFAEPGAADDELDDALVDVLDAIGNVDGVVWTAANRAVVGDQYHCYEIPLTLYVEKEVK